MRAACYGTNFRNKGQDYSGCVVQDGRVTRAGIEAYLLRGVDQAALRRAQERWRAKEWDEARLEFEVAMLPQGGALLSRAEQACA